LNDDIRNFLIGGQATMLALVTMVMVAISWGVFATAPSSDLMALYLAGQAFGTHHLDQIYPAAAPLFDLSIPQSWPDLARQAGLGDLQLYPYIYPPLWAGLAAPLTKLISAHEFFALARILNALLMTLSAVLAWRILRPHMSLARWVMAGLALALITPIGFVALYQNQPQILVSALILLAIERSRAKAPVSAGIALALAASIKLYPLLFIVIWLGRRERAALLSFGASGAVLALASLAIGGLALNLVFLERIAMIAHTVLVTQITFNFASLFGQFLSPDLHALASADHANAVLIAGVYGSKTLLASLTVKAVLLAGLALAWLGARLSRDERTLYGAIWPALLILVSLTSPLSWAYHYLSVVFLFPALLIAPRQPRQRIVAALALAAISLPVMVFLSRLPVPFMLAQTVGTVALTVLIGSFLRMPSSDPQLP